jgi:hypothetical protein
MVYKDRKEKVNRRKTKKKRENNNNTNIHMQL